MKKRVYSSRRLSSKDFDRIILSLGSSCVVVGVDVSKHELMLMIRSDPSSRSDAATFSGPYRVANPGGIPEAVALIRQIQSRGGVRVAMESSGTYADAFRQSLSDAKLELHRVETKRSHDYAEVFDGVSSQHDGKDAAVIAELCAIGKSSPWAYEQMSESDSRMRLLVEWIDSHDRIKRMWISRLEGLLARHWPEATGLLDLTSGTLLSALAHYGGPAALAADDQATRRLKSWGKLFLKESTAAALIVSARSTLGVRQNPVDQERLGYCASQAHEASLAIKRYRLQLKKAARDNKTIQSLASAVGIVTACVLWARLGDPRDYDSAQAYRKAMGLNLVERSSGQYKGRLRLSKRGDPLVRRWMYMAALRLITEHAELHNWYRRKRQQNGGCHHKAMAALMRQLAIALHKIAVSEEPFDPARLFNAVAASVAGGRCGK